MTRLVCIFASQKLRFGHIKLWPATLVRVAFSSSNPRRNVKKQISHWDICFFGDPPGIRTPDPLLKRQLLCQLS